MISQLLSRGFFKIIICMGVVQLFLFLTHFWKVLSNLWFSETCASVILSNAKIVLSNMTVDFDRTAHCQCNHQCLTELQQILTEQQWLCFDRTTSLTENLDEFAFDRNTNGKNVLSKNTLSRARFHKDKTGQNINVELESVEGGVWYHEIIPYNLWQGK